MKTKHKALLLSLCAVALVAGSVFGTMAYLTSDDQVVNTFTVGNVAIDLKETKVKTDGTVEDPSASEKPMTDEGNDYHLIPGHTYIKDPTVTVKAGSEESYIKMTVTVTMANELDTIFATHNIQDLELVFSGYNAENWTLNDVRKDTEKNTRTYEFWYKETVSGKDSDDNDADNTLPALFTSIKVPGEVTKEELATLYQSETNHLTITAKAYAIQADGFTDAADAWAHFD